MELTLPYNLEVKKGFYRYKCVVRDEQSNEIIGYLEGNKKFHRDYQGETFYRVGKMVFVKYLNHKGKEETLKLSEIDTSDLDLILLDKHMTVLIVYPRAKQAQHQRDIAKLRKRRKTP
ncbi:hypothetical protein [Deinococcus ficus]|uniref:hypothetical protein n=1 Tax=Deinococcus ficus TaxID=317577 RepID=UPI00131B3B6B|nr:hypothetical protein [Deinococcus ficus]